MKMKTASLTGKALEWALEKVAGRPVTELSDRAIQQERIEVVRGNDVYFPSKNEKGDYYEPLWLASTPGARRKFHGQTPVMAAQRCYLDSRVGEEIEIPDEILEAQC